MRLIEMASGLILLIEYNVCFLPCYSTNVSTKFMCSALTGARQPSANGRESGATSTVPRVLPGQLDTPRAAMIKPVLPTGDLLLPGRGCRCRTRTAGFQWTLWFRWT